MYVNKTFLGGKGRTKRNNVQVETLSVRLHVYLIAKFSVGSCRNSGVKAAQDCYKHWECNEWKTVGKWHLARGYSCGVLNTQAGPPHWQCYLHANQGEMFLLNGVCSYYIDPVCCSVMLKWAVNIAVWFIPSWNGNTQTHMEVEEILLSISIVSRAIDKCEKTCRWNSLSLMTFSLG